MPNSEKDGFIHQNSNASKQEKEYIINTYYRSMGSEKQNSFFESKMNSDSKKTTDKQEDIITRDNDFEVTPEIIRLFGEGYSKSEYRKMHNKYENLKLNYSIQTNLHQEALATYVRFKVKEEDATAKGDVAEAMKTQRSTVRKVLLENGKLTPKQLSESDLHGGINSFSEIFKAVEQAGRYYSHSPIF